MEGILNDMGKRRSVSENEKAEIVEMLAAKVQTVDISKRLKLNETIEQLKNLLKVLIHKEKRGQMLKRNEET